MEIYPALDLIDGRCVRLARGAFDRVTTYDSDPEKILDRYSSKGAAWAHVVDLDGARAGAPRQHEVIAGLSARTSLRVQAAGGIRGETHVSQLLKAGIDRVVVGSMAVDQPEIVAAWIGVFGPDALTLAFDVRLIDGEPLVATQGWRQQSAVSLWSALDAFADAGLRHVLITDIARDGMLSGPNLELIQEVGRRAPGLKVQASGGIRSLADISDLAESGAAAAIVGKAFLEGVLLLEEAIDAGA